MRIRKIPSYIWILAAALLIVLAVIAALSWYMKQEDHAPAQQGSNIIIRQAPTAALGTARNAPAGEASLQTSTPAVVSAALPTTTYVLSGQSTTPEQVSSGQTRSVLPSEQTTTIRPARPVQDLFDIVLLIDSSGSMKRTDPGNYRKDAAKLFASLVGKNDRIAVMSFGDAATMLIPLTANNDQSRPAVFRAIDRISSREFSTNILDAVQKGYDELKQSTTKNRILVMMSDGRLALGSAEKDSAAHAELMKLLPELKDAGIRIYTVAFTEESDSTLLATMARETDGSFRYAKTERDVHLMFTSIFERLKAPDSVPFEGESFVLDREIREAVVLITKAPGTAVALRDPNGGQHTSSRHPSSFNWYASNVFDMITISEPPEGMWTVRLSTNEGNKVYVLTDLSLRCALDRDFVRKGESVRIDAWLEKQGVIVTGADLAANAVFSAEVTGPDGKTTAVNLVDDGSPPGAGTSGINSRHHVELPAAGPGEYTVRIRATGRTFKREKTVPFRVLDAPSLAPAPRTPQAASVAPNNLPDEEIHWGPVLLRLGLINLALASFAGIVLFLIKKFARKKVLS
ncbi:MAG TPA: VWA domain-containing protein [Nitrospirota bacterium]|nr:VWA domain-containing protein [Nitrospirota bacterium]